MKTLLLPFLGFYFLAALFLLKLGILAVKASVDILCAVWNGLFLTIFHYAGRD